MELRWPTPYGVTDEAWRKKWKSVGDSWGYKVDGSGREGLRALVENGEFRAEAQKRIIKDMAEGMEEEAAEEMGRALRERWERQERGDEDDDDEEDETAWRYGWKYMESELEEERKLTESAVKAMRERWE